MFNTFIGIGHRPAILPAGVDHTHLVDITQVHQQYAVFMDPHTGVVYDGNVLHQQMLDQLNQEQSQ